MNVFYILLTSIALSFSQVAIPYESVASAFEANDYSAISQMGEQKILVDILGTESVYSQSQASLILKDFFAKKPNGTFNFVFKGKETAEGAFAIGNYSVTNEKFRVTIHFKKAKEEFKIESLTIEK